MQIEIDGLHEQALLRLAQRNNEKTGRAMVRILIREAAREVGLWDSRFDILEDNEAHSLETETE